jgi:hypothetical protein
VRAEVGGQWRVEVGGGKRSVVGFWRFLVWFGLVVGGWWSVVGRRPDRRRVDGRPESDVGGFRMKAFKFFLVVIIGIITLKYDVVVPP